MNTDKKKRDPRQDLRPWLRKLPVFVCFLVLMALYPLVLAVGAGKGLSEGHREAIDLLKRFF